MSSNFLNQVSFLRTSRNFSNDINLLTSEISRTYLDIATAVNSRTIGLFPTTISAITGESWFLSKNQRQQSFRQAYTFTTFASINHGLNINRLERFVRGFGSYTDGTNWYGLIFGTNVALAGQAVFYITPTQIVFNTAGAPASTRGTVVLEWLSQV